MDDIDENVQFLMDQGLSLEDAIAEVEAAMEIYANGGYYDSVHADPEFIDQVDEYREPDDEEIDVDDPDL